jgi:DNA-binding beta-propeller fold protein YncE
MDGGRFEGILRSLGGGAASRRSVARGLAGIGLGALVAGRAGAGGDVEAAGDRCAKLGKACSKEKKCCNGLACRNGTCACTGGKTKCGTRCRNLKTDPNNCGACGQACFEGEACVGGFCASSTGSEGDGRGRFARPTGIAFDPVGTLFVTEVDLSKVKASLSGGFLEFGEPGSEDGQFSEPEGIAISGDDVFVADTGNHRIQRFDRIGTHELSWGTFGNGDLQFKNPAAIAVDAVDGEGGTVYVADTGNNLIKRYTRNGVFLSAFGRPGAGRGEFSGPTGVATFRDDQHVLRVYVVDGGNDRVQIFDADENVVGVFGRKGPGQGEFDGPQGVVVAPDGSVFVTDGGNDRVQHFAADGRFLRVFGSSGSAVGRFDGPHGVAVDRNGDLHVADVGNDRIQTFRTGLLFSPAARFNESSASIDVRPSRSRRTAELDERGADRLGKDDATGKAAGPGGKDQGKEGRRA